MYKITFYSGKCAAAGSKRRNIHKKKKKALQANFGELSDCSKRLSIMNDLKWTLQDDTTWNNGLVIFLKWFY